MVNCPECQREFTKIAAINDCEISSLPIVRKTKKSSKKRPLVEADDVKDETESVSNVSIDSNYHSEEDDDKSKAKTATDRLDPEQLRFTIRKIWMKQKEVLSEMFPALKAMEGSYDFPTDIFFMDSILVTPTRFRPMRGFGNQQFLDGQSAIYLRILKDANLITMLREVRAKAMSETAGKSATDSKSGNSPATTQSEREMQIISNNSKFKDAKGADWEDKMAHVKLAMQIHVNSLLNEEMDKLNMSGGKSGIKQMIEKKEGLLRTNMLGKRVNFSGRSVIAPDPNIHLHEVGIPKYIASVLTVAEPVNAFNYYDLRQAVINGDEYPGANQITMENGNTVSLSRMSKVKREALASRLLSDFSSSGRER